MFHSRAVAHPAGKLYGPLSLLLCICLLGLLSQTTPTSIASGGSPDIPGGSYQQTCHDTSVAGTTLSSTCKTMSGSWRRTQLADFTSCLGDISNINGTLTCNKAPIPGGSYSQTCRFTRADANNLYSQCKTRAGGWQDTQLNNYQSCQSDISNIDGFLTCNRGNAPAGSYSQTCRDVSVADSTLYATCKTRAGGWQATLLQNFQSCRSPIDNIDGFLSCSHGNASPPFGSYLQTCRDINVDGTVLQATCKQKNESWKRTELKNFDRCTAQIANDDGNLKCPQPVFVNPLSVNTICCGYRIPSGWIKYNDESLPASSCHKPASSADYNVCFIRRYTDARVGDTLVVCADAPTPEGWVVIGEDQDHQKCGHPTAASTAKNVKTIKRMR